MSLKHGLLGLLNYEPMTGYELDKEFKRSLGYFWYAKQQQIYRELDDMEKKGWLTSERVIQNEKPNKRVYSITTEGKTEFMDWLNLPESYMKNALQQKSEILLRVFFGSEADDDVTLELLHRYREECIENIQNMENLKIELAAEKSIHPPDVVKYWEMTVLSFEIMSKARLEWVEKSISLCESVSDGLGTQQSK
jgi:DNA-binding PadR family transcriptional regulator